MFRLRLTPLRLALLVAALLSTMRLRSCSQYLDLLDARLGDYRLIQRGRQLVSPEIVIVAVDDASIDAVGRWPWSRAVVGRLVDRLTEARAAVIGFDIVQSEPTAPQDLSLLRTKLKDLDDATWAKVREGMSVSPEDEILATSVKASGRTVLGYFFSKTGGNAAASPKISQYVVKKPKGIAPEVDANLDRLLHQERAVVGNLPMLNAGATAVGFFNIEPDPDGYCRHALMAMRYGDRTALPLSIAVLQVYLKLGNPVLRYLDPFSVEIGLGKLTIPIGLDGNLVINYRGQGRTFPHISASDVLEGRVGADQLAGKIVIVGVTAKAVYDLRVTPLDKQFPGVETHANVIDNVLRQDFLIRPAWAPQFEVGVIIAVALLLTGVLHYARGVWGAIVGLAALAAYLIGSQWLFVARGLVLSVFYPSAAIVLTYSALTVHQYVTQDREKRRQRKALELYLSPSLAAIVSEHAGEMRMGGEKRDHTVLFSDVRGFTTIAEQLDADVLVESLNAYLGAMTDVIFEYDGMLDKYIGDGIMAIWSSPLPQEDHAVLACRAALSMMAKLATMQIEWSKKGWPEFVIRIGLHTGPMIFGNMGSSQHLSLTVVGDNVNLGARLEGLNKAYDTNIIASESTVQQAGDAIVVRELDMVRVKGRLQPVRVYEVLGLAEDASRWAAMLVYWNSGLAAYRERRWDDAIAEFQSVINVRAFDGPARIYIARCKGLMESPPPEDWGGVRTMEEK